MPDTLYVRKARSSILSHSELIWERVKGALGVPPELDVDCFVDETDFRFAGWGIYGDEESAIDSGDESFSSTEKVGPSPGRSAQIEATSGGGSARVGIPSGAASDLRTDANDAVSPSSMHLPHSLNRIQDHLSISPILAHSGSQNLNLSLGVSDNDGLGDITEDVEDEEEAMAMPDAKQDVPNPKPALDESPQIQGLRIHTSPLPSSLSFNTGSLSSPRSISGSRPGSLYGSRPGSRAGHVPGTQSPTFSVLPLSSSSAGHIPGPHRSDSFGAETQSGRRSSFGSLSGLAFSYGQTRREGDKDTGEDADYDPVSERSLRNPHFPSNFARLDTGPTVVSK